MERLAGRVDDCADRLSTIDRVLPALSVPAAAFGAGSAGSPGRIGQELHRHWTAVLAARSGEAASAAVHLTDLARSLRTTDGQYAETDATAARRLSRES